MKESIVLKKELPELPLKAKIYTISPNIKKMMIKVKGVFLKLLKLELKIISLAKK
jgi:hypothetical protein